MIKMAIMGFGTIGSGVFDVVKKNADILEKNIGEPLEIKYVLDIREFPGQPVQEVLVHDVNTILEDPEVSVVVETMGGVEPAFTFVSGALAAGKSVATSNKELVAQKGVELQQIAREHNVSFLFEASVGGGIPILRPLLTCLTADRIESITGILNGTTNYILTKMDRGGWEFADALAQARAKEYAERKPEADIEGYDACRKIAILASIVLGQKVDYHDVYTEGISKISVTDFTYAHSLGCEIKLLGDFRMVDGRAFVCVAPFLVKAENPLYAVSGVFNGILVHGNMVDDVMFYGRGAGKDATASAVMGDVVEALQNPGKTVYPGWKGESCPLAPQGEAERAFLIRVPEQESQKAQEVFAGARPVKAKIPGEAGFLTEVMSEAAFEEAAAQVTVLSRIRVFEA